MMETAVKLREEGDVEAAEKIEKRVIVRTNTCTRLLIEACKRENVPFVVAP